MYCGEACQAAKHKYGRRGKRILCKVVRVCSDYRWYEGARNISRSCQKQHSLKLYHIEFADAFNEIFLCIIAHLGGIMKLVSIYVNEREFFFISVSLFSSHLIQHSIYKPQYIRCVSKDLFMQILYFGIDKWWQIIEIYLRKWP